MDSSNFMNMSVGAIVNENFAAARVFKYYGIDYCVVLLVLIPIAYVEL